MAADLVKSEKNFPCEICGLVRFSKHSTLLAHQRYYCVNRTDAARPPPPLHQAAPSSEAAAADSLQKSPQTMPFPISLAEVEVALQLPPLAIWLAGLKTLSEALQAGMPNIFMPSTSAPTHHHNEMEERPALKKFPCSCGVSFQSERTLQAHRAGYCADTLHERSTFVENADRPHSTATANRKRRLSTSSPPSSTRPKTSNTRYFACTMCAYRGFSVRGMRKHVRADHPASLADCTDNVDDIDSLYREEPSSAKTDG